MQNFTVYSKEGCNHCKQIIDVLGLSELSYVEYKLGVHFTKEAFYGEFGDGATFPQIVLNGVKLGGTKDSIRYMQKENICCIVQ
tara:strand:- start:295 stop:546 length:252 start_codon:yes stop_codon:yes gene_type:complete